MARPLWSGSIQISLVGFAVEIFPATQTTKPFAFHEIDRNTLTRVRRQSVSTGPAPTGEEEEPVKHSLHIAPAAAQEHAVERADIVKGYEYEKGKYAIVEPDELKNLRLAGKKTIEISQFAQSAEIAPELFEKPYFVMPKAGPQAKAFSVVRQAMRESGKVGLGEIVFSGRQHLMTLAPPHDPNQPGMMLYTLRFGAELREAREYSNNVEDAPADKTQLALARQLIDAYTEPFQLSSFKDHYEEALRDLVEAKIRNLPAPQPEVESKPAKVVDLMEALRASILQKKPATPDSQEEKPPVKTRKKRSA
jgi:DNA end-binding protein Ku